MNRERLIWSGAIALPFLFAGFLAWAMPRYFFSTLELENTSIIQPQGNTTRKLPHAALNLDPATRVNTYPLIGMDAKPFSFDQFRGRWVWVFFGYTFCPDICPITLGWLTQELNSMAKEKTQEMP